MLPANTSIAYPPAPLMDYPFYQQFTTYGSSMLPPYSSPVSSLYPNSSFNEMPTTEISPPTDPSQKQRSPEEELKYRQKRMKNNEAAKASRRKRSCREKDLQEKVHQQANQLQHLLKERQHEQLQMQALAIENSQLKQQQQQNHLEKQQIQQENESLKAELARYRLQAKQNLITEGFQDNKENLFISFNS